MFRNSGRNNGHKGKSLAEPEYQTRFSRFIQVLPAVFRKTVLVFPLII
jgi:hypothetical protein